MPGANRNLPEPFSVMASKNDVEEALKDIRQQGVQITVDGLTDNDIVYIATIWSCLNNLRTTALSKGQVGELLTAYLGFDEVAAWYHDVTSRPSVPADNGKG